MPLQYFVLLIGNRTDFVKPTQSIFGFRFLVTGNILVFNRLRSSFRLLFAQV